MKKLGYCLVIVVAACLVGCHKDTVTTQDVKNWSQAHDANGNPVSDGPSTGR